MLSAVLCYETALKNNSAIQILVAVSLIISLSFSFVVVIFLPQAAQRSL